MELVTDAEGCACLADDDLLCFVFDPVVAGAVGAAVLGEVEEVEDADDELSAAARLATNAFKETDGFACKDDMRLFAALAFDKLSGL